MYRLFQVMPCGDETWVCYIYKLMFVVERKTGDRLFKITRVDWNPT